MIKSELSQSKIEQYKELLKKPYWELYEAAYFLVGVTKFDAFYNLDPEQSELYRIERIGTLPIGAAEKLLDSSKEISEENKYSERNFETIIDKLWCAAENDDIQAHALKTHFFERGITKPKKYTYLIRPRDAIALTITQGFILPIEFQVAASLYQIGNETQQTHTSLNKGQKNKVQRQALVQAYLYKYPDFSIAKICRRLESLKGYPGFEFIHDSENRNREVVTEIKRQSTGHFPMVPDLLVQEREIIKFDFERLHIAINTIAHLLQLSKRDITSQSLLAHPLIEYYSAIGGEPVKNIIKFSLKNSLHILDMIADNAL